MQPWSVGATYPNFLGEEGDARMRTAFGASADRVAAVKAESRTPVHSVVPRRHQEDHAS